MTRLPMHDLSTPDIARYRIAREALRGVVAVHRYALAHGKRGQRRQVEAAEREMSLAACAVADRALADAESASFVERLHAMMFPERYPPGHRLHEPDHVFWESHADDPVFNDCFQWDSETVEWVAQAIITELARTGGDRGVSPHA